jgi:hypothetical protein
MIRALFAAEAAPAHRTLGEAFRGAKRAADAEALFVRASGRYPLTATGDANTYALFAELFSRLMCEVPARPCRAGVIVPTGIATDAPTSAFFGWLSSDRRLVQLLDFQSGAGFFNDIGHARFKFALMTIGGRNAIGDGRARLAFFLRRMTDFAQSDRFFELSADEISLINPSTRTLPTFRSRADAELTKRIYSRVPVLIDDSKGQAGNPWGIRFLAMFHMANDSGLFRTAEKLQADGLRRYGADWNDTPGERWLPLYEGKMVHHYDHRWATYDEENVGDDDARRPSSEEKADPDFMVSPRYWVSARGVLARIAAVPKALAKAYAEGDDWVILVALANWVEHGRGDEITQETFHESREALINWAATTSGCCRSTLWIGETSASRSTAPLYLR